MSDDVKPANDRRTSRLHVSLVADLRAGKPVGVEAAEAIITQEQHITALTEAARSVLNVASDIVDLGVDAEMFEDALPLLDRWNLVAPQLKEALGDE